MYFYAVVGVPFCLCAVAAPTTKMLLNPNEKDIMNMEDNTYTMPNSDKNAQEIDATKAS